MNNFGLGLVLEFTDNATPGIQRVTQAYEAMENSFNNGVSSTSEALASQVGMNLSSLGDSLMGVGDSITGVFKSLVNNVKTTGSDFESFRITLGAVYNDADVAQQKVDQLLEFSKKSPFEIQDTKDMLLVLKAAGVDAFEELTNASDGFSQQALSWITDIMAFKPDVPVERWKIALTNFLGSGDAKVLRNILDSGNIEDIIGRGIADTTEGRMQDLMDVVSNLGVENLTNELFGTMEQQASNLGDVFTELYLKIGDSGAFDSIKRIQSNLLSILTGDEVASSMDTIASSISEAIVSILEPVERLTEKIHDIGVELVNFVSQHPKVLTIGLAFLTIVGGAVTLLGVVSKLGGAITSFLASIKYLSGGMGVLTMLRTGLWNILKLFAPLAAAAYIFYEVWNSNIGGVQEKLSNMVSNIVGTISLIWDAFSDNTLSVENFEKAKEMGILPLIEAILQLKYHWGFFVDGFKEGLDNFFESLSNILIKMGILDTDVSGFGELITTLLEKITAPGLTDEWGNFGEILGEVAGWVIVAVAILPVVIKGVSFIVKLISGIVGFIKPVVSIITTIVRVIFSVFGFIKTAISSISLSSIITGILNAIKGLFSFIGTGISWILTGIGDIVIAILGAFGIVCTLPAWLVGLIVAAIAAIITLIVVFWDDIKAFFINIGNSIADAFTSAWETFTSLPWVQSAMTAVEGVITSVANTVSGITSGIVGTVKGIIGSVTEALMPIIRPVISIISTVKDTISSIAQSVWSIIQNIVETVVYVGSCIWDVIKSIASTVWNVLTGIYNAVKSVVMGIWDIISSIIDLICNIFYAIYEIIRTIVLAIIYAFQQAWDWICTGLGYVYDFFASIFSWIYDNVIEPIVSAIGDAFDWLYTNVIEPIISAIGSAFEWLNTNIIEPVCEFFKDAFDAIAEKVNSFCDTVKSVFTTVKEFICDAIQKVSDFVMPIIDAISGAISWIADGISNVIDTVSGFFGGIGDFFGGIGDGLAEMVGLSTGGYVKTTGIAVLHPNEVVVNDTLTKGLGGFLDDYNSAKFTSSPLIQQDVVSTDDYEETRNPMDPKPPVVVTTPPTNGGDQVGTSPMQSIVRNTTTNNYQEDNHKQDTVSSQDNSVTFEEGSIAIYVDKDTDLSDKGLDELAEKLMKKMARKMQLRNMQTRV